MVKRAIKYLLFALVLLLLVVALVVKPIDRTPYQELPFYPSLVSSLDSLQKTFTATPEDTLRLGYGKASITPQDTIPLAGYGVRNPMEYNVKLDSVFIRAIVLKTASSQALILSCDLLIVHPDITKAVTDGLDLRGWDAEEIYFSATHSHSSIGGWAPGKAGEIFSGDYDPKIVERIIQSMLEAERKASAKMHRANVGYMNNELGKLVKNRLMKEGEEDVWMRNLFFTTSEGLISLSAFSAHATCFSSHSSALTGDFPSYFHQKLLQDSTVVFSSFMAGAVGSMGPEMGGLREQPGARYIGETMAEQIGLLLNFGVQQEPLVSLTSFTLDVPLRDPQLKISRSWCIRPWVFRALVGDYKINMRVLKINDNLLIGFPSDFSGELALPLYEYARSKNLNLIITSFNGGYIGYVTQDDRYDLKKYETRTMNWYGPDSGAYFSEIARRIIDSVSK